MTMKRMLVVGFVLWVRSAAAYNYCHFGVTEYICHGDPHIMCDLDSVKQGEPLVRQVPMTRKVRNTILTKHNELRNLMAGGEEQSSGGAFPKAARMCELIWDKQLGYTAQVHAGRCSTEHDKCRGSKAFPYAGQNLGKHTAEGSIEHVVLDMISEWYKEKDAVSSSGMASADADITDQGGHLAVMVGERSSRIGCAVALCGDAGDTLYMTCNYESTVITGKPVYVASEGDAASQCDHWNTDKSDTYKNLCANSGSVLALKDLKNP